MATLIRNAWKKETQQDTFCELTQHLDLNNDDHDLPVFAPKIVDTKGLKAAAPVSKWCKTTAPAFVPVKHYSIVELLRMRAQASTHIHIDPIDYDGEDSPCVRAKRSPVLVAVNPVPLIEPLFVPLFVPAPAPKQEDHETETEEEPSDKKLPEQQKVTKRHRSRRGGRKHPAKPKAPCQPEAEKKSEKKAEKMPEKVPEKKPTSASSVRRRRRAPAPAKERK